MKDRLRVGGTKGAFTSSRLCCLLWQCSKAVNAFCYGFKLVQQSLVRKTCASSHLIANVDENSPANPLLRGRKPHDNRAFD